MKIQQIAHTEYNMMRKGTSLAIKYESEVIR